MLIYLAPLGGSGVSAALPAASAGAAIIRAFAVCPRGDSMSFAFVFPGQGSQSIGMLAALSQTDPVVRATFDEASAVLGYDLWQLIQEGPKERLDSTECTQPAMLAAGVATWRLWHKRGGADPIMVSGTASVSSPRSFVRVPSNSRPRSISSDFVDR